MMENLSALLTELIVNNMSTPAQKLKTVLDYLLGQNAALHQKYVELQVKYVEALDSEKAEEIVVAQAVKDKEAAILDKQAAEDLVSKVQVELNDSANTVAALQAKYDELEAKYAKLVADTGSSEDAKQAQIDELMITLQSYVDKLPVDEFTAPVEVVPAPVEEVKPEAPIISEVPAEPSVLEVPVTEVQEVKPVEVAEMPVVEEVKTETVEEEVVVPPVASAEEVLAVADAQAVEE